VTVAFADVFVSMFERFPFSRASTPAPPIFYRIYRARGRRFLSDHRIAEARRGGGSPASVGPEERDSRWHGNGDLRSPPQHPASTAGSDHVEPGESDMSAFRVGY